jgi:small subunit ribosomal protein S16
VEQIDLARVDYWVGKGAKASDTVGAIVKRAREGKPMTPEQAKEKAATPAATPAAGN